VKATETQLVRACLDYLAARRIFAWRENSGGMKRGKRFIRFGGVKGMADILGILPDGRILAIECKMPGNGPSQDQLDFAARVKASNGVALLVYKPEDLWTALHSIGYCADRSPAPGKG